jgi:hypothetical protein
MEWSLKFDWKPPVANLLPSDKIFLLGSCFAQNIGEKLFENRFKAHVNPFGIVYNPLSVLDVLHTITGQLAFTEEDVYCFNELWTSDRLHSSFSSTSKLDLMHKIDALSQASLTHFEASQWVFITFGTAKVFKNISNHQIVANCHKRPAADFSSDYLSIKEIVTAWKPLLAEYPHKHFYFSVSPVRYIREGLIASNNGKAILRLAIDKLVEELPNVHYFPAFELVHDVLRDYRFYTEDKVHPNTQAVQFVFDFLVSNIFANEAKAFLNEWKPIKNMLTHKVLFPETKQGQDFEMKRARALADFNKKWKV